MIGANKWNQFSSCLPLSVMPWRFCSCKGHPGIGCYNPNCRKTLSGWCHSTTWKQISGTTVNQATLPTTQIGGNAAITVAVYGSQTNYI
ncbi:hypothetical protein HKD37_07G020209 [Glycine soja]